MNLATHYMQMYLKRNARLIRIIQLNVSLCLSYHHHCHQHHSIHHYDAKNSVHHIITVVIIIIIMLTIFMTYTVCFHQKSRKKKAHTIFEGKGNFPDLKTGRFKIYSSHNLQITQQYIISSYHKTMH